MSRKSELKRVTKETDIELKLNIDGGEQLIDTGIGFFDHMLTAMFFYAGFGISLKVKGDLYVDAHHTVEDTGIVIGQAIKQALGDKVGIKRFSSKFVPMDEALCMTVLDISGRSYHVYDAIMHQERIGCYDSCLTEEFMRALSSAAGLTLHQKALYGKNAHHITEALFKSLGLALKEAVQIETNKVTSTKGVLV